MPPNVSDNVDVRPGDAAEPPQETGKALQSLTLFFPVYNDEKTVRRVTEKALKVCEALAEEYDVLIIDDGSPDRSGVIADELAREYPQVRVIHHEGNQGYGAALRTGFAHSRGEWIAFTDGDDEYDVYDVHKLVALKDFYDLVITFRYAKVYSGKRQVISWVYNATLRALFRTNYRDISTGLRLVRRSLIEQLDLTSDSPFIGAELAIKTMLKGYRVGEVGIQTFPREFGQGASTSRHNIMATIQDMVRNYREIFSPSYDLPRDERKRIVDISTRAGGRGGGRVPTSVRRQRSANDPS